MRLEHALEHINTYPFHMPGHKRNPDFGLPSANMDITEIDGFDNLHAPVGMLAQLEQELAELYGSKKSFLSVNGSTCGILAAVHAVCEPGDTILIARNCHKSVYNACFLAKLHTEYLVPEFDGRYGIYGAITQTEIDRALQKHPQAKAVVLTSPTYEGVVSRVTCPVPLIVDAAHGAHFSMAPWLPARALGDIVVTSLHKTLPALTQTAAVHLYNENYTAAVKRYMGIFETSSPSYILMSSASRMLQLVQKQSLFDDLLQNLKGLYALELSHLEFIRTDDITKINLSTVRSNMTGNQLAQQLRRRGIEVELADAVHVVAMATIGDTAYGFELLKKALTEIDGMLQPGAVCITRPQLPKKEAEIWQVHKTEPTALENSIGKICGETVFAYPPGVPLLLPGERIDAQLVDAIQLALKQGTNLLCESNLLPGKILTKIS